MLFNADHLGNTQTDKNTPIFARYKRLPIKRSLILVKIVQYSGSFSYSAYNMFKVTRHLQIFIVGLLIIQLLGHPFEMVQQHCGKSNFRKLCMDLIGQQVCCAQLQNICCDTTNPTMFAQCAYDGQWCII